jgi:diacylglycerol kinase family enzyme
MAHPELEQFVNDYPGGRPQLCRDATISEGRLSQIIGGDQPSPKLAMTFHRLSRGRVPASILRPDLWRRPEDVPVPEGAE